MRDASDITRYDRRRSELSYAPLHMKQDTSSIEKYPPKPKPKPKPKPMNTLTCRSVLVLST